MTEIFPPQPAISTQVPAFCPGDSSAIELSGLPNGTNFQFEWYQDSNLVNAYQNNQALNHSYPLSSGGNYHVVVTDPFGCSGTAGPLSMIEVLPYTASISGEDTLCTGDTLWLQANTGPGILYQWYQDENPIAGANLPLSGSGRQRGNYWVAESDLAGCGADSSGSYEVYSIPGATPPLLITQGDTNLFCEGSSLWLAAQVEPGQSYQWWENESPMSPQPGDSLFR